MAVDPTSSGWPIENEEIEGAKRLDTGKLEWLFMMAETRCMDSVAQLHTASQTDNSLPPFILFRCLGTSLSLEIIYCRRAIFCIESRYLVENSTVLSKITLFSNL